LSLGELPPGVTVYERGWLSSNNILIQGEGCVTLVDSGYHTHAQQTLALVRADLAGRPLDFLLNTHLHSDHCGGNHVLQAAFPYLQTWIPPGLAEAVAIWDADALTYTPTGQTCEPFRFDGLLQPGSIFGSGSATWEVHGAPGHDTHSIILFEPQSRTLISADALWETGFGIVFPELEGISAFVDVGATLDLIERLAPNRVIPGHGRVFSTVDLALSAARRRLDGFVKDPQKHVTHAGKVLLKFKLLELQSVGRAELLAWALSTPYFRMISRQLAYEADLADWVGSLLDALIRSGAASRHGEQILNS
jgi:glyoxylase-like metal-dependent hydrolase (beta-lactamase superfamily II)